MDSITPDSVTLDAHHKTITHLSGEPKESEVAWMENVEIARNEDRAGHRWSFRFRDHWLKPLNPRRMRADIAQPILPTGWTESPR